jgi:hypothetical protein
MFGAMNSIALLKPGVAMSEILMAIGGTHVMIRDATTATSLGGAPKTSGN